MPQTKIQGKFYPLKSEEWLDSINKLTHSELKILYYVRSLDPYNNGIDITPAQIARDLSTEKNKMHRSTVGRALKSLDRKGFINMELIKVRIKVNPGGFLAEPEPEIKPKLEAKNDVVATQPCCDHATNVVTTQHRVQPRNIECAHTTQSAPTQQSGAETQSEQKVETPKIFKTYSDFKDSLREDEREAFLKFVEYKTKNYQRKIIDYDDYLRSKNANGQNRYEIYYQEFKKCQKAQERVQENQRYRLRTKYTTEEKQAAIARFQAERNCNRVDLDDTQDNPTNNPENNDRNPKNE